MDLINEVPIEQSPQAAAVASQNGQRIGHIYKKALFREYTDASFIQQSPRPEVSAWSAGILTLLTLLCSGWACWDRSSVLRSATLSG